MASTSNHRRLLERIAHDALVDRGLEPEFPREALRQLDRIDGAAMPEGDEDIADLRGLAWCSIDNNDSRGNSGSRPLSTSAS